MNPVEIGRIACDPAVLPAALLTRLLNLPPVRRIVAPAA
jgi:hypothetical protein